MFTTEQAKRLIKNIRLLQARSYTEEEFFRLIKRRLRVFTGMNETIFYNEKQVAELLVELGFKDDRKEKNA